jgi:hypothetical protein
MTRPAQTASRSSQPRACFEGAGERWSVLLSNDGGHSTAGLLDAGVLRETSDGANLAPSGRGFRRPHGCT